ncbi:MAG: penicillin-binding protein activator [Gammaproteobacteria bacterium]|nr:penicillin-binding protein activator [Gammaproteobacteria bacterium]
MKLSIRLIFVTVLLLTLNACGPVSDPTRMTTADTALEAQAVIAEQSGDYNAAGQFYLELATSTVGQLQAQSYLRAALAFWQAKDELLSSDSLSKVQRQVLSAAQQIDAAILEAEIAQFRRQTEQSLTSLANVDLNKASKAQTIQVLTLRANAYQITENWLEKANSHLALAKLLPDDQQVQNQVDLWQALTSLTPQALDLFNPGIPPAVDSGWFALAYAITAYQNNPEALLVALEDWKRNYPNHPADPALYQKSIESGTQLPQQLADIAVLLPSTGPYAEAAAAIKQGIIAAHYSQNTPTKLHFLDVETDAGTGQSNVWQRYQQAIAMQASIVIGPLSKESIQALVDADTLDIPVLALNRVSNTIHKNNLFQFGLAPEDDATTAADFALNQGYSRAVILSPQNEWGNRIASTFSDHWIANGGTVLKQAFYQESDNDFSTTITSLFGLDASQQRYQALKQRLGQSLEFEPRRRQDIDFVFLIARSSKARQLMPQLKFHRSGSLPIIATSHAYAGFANSQQDIDLNDLKINDIPWIFEQSAASDPAYLALSTNKDTNFNSIVRLYALGADAYRLIPNLNGLSRSPSTTFNGATGELSINENGQINRKMLPATFENGFIKPIAITNQ